MRRIAVEILLMAAIGAALAALGPFGSYALPAGQRTLLWIGLILAGYAIFRPMIPVGRWLAELAGLPAWAARLIVLSVGAIPLTALAGFALQVTGSPTGPFALLYAQVWGIGLAIMLFMARFVGEPESEPAPASQAVGPAAPVRPRFLDRLPSSFGDELLCLGMEDHYVRAYGGGRSALLLMRLRDAVAELDGMAGMQVHRSWWVADSAVEGVERDGRRLRLRLAGGLRVPVARSYESAVRSRGWRIE